MKEQIEFPITKISAEEIKDSRKYEDDNSEDPGLIFALKRFLKSFLLVNSVILILYFGFCLLNLLLHHLYKLMIVFIEIWNYRGKNKL